MRIENVHTGLADPPTDGQGIFQNMVDLYEQLVTSIPCALCLKLKYVLLLALLEICPVDVTSCTNLFLFTVYAKATSQNS